MNLQERHCICGQAFKCLATSSQKYHSQECQIKGDKTNLGWGVVSKRRREYVKKQEEKTQITSAITPDLNVKQIRLGLKEDEGILENTIASGEKETKSVSERLINPIMQETGKNEMKEVESTELPMNTESDIDLELENYEELTQQNLERHNRITTINGIRQQSSIQRQEISQKEFSHSKSLIDESIGQLQELTKLSVATLHSQDAKVRDPQMVNAAINSAKAINELLKTKLTAAKMFR